LSGWQSKFEKNYSPSDIYGGKKNADGYYLDSGIENPFEPYRTKAIGLEGSYEAGSMFGGAGGSFLLGHDETWNNYLLHSVNASPGMSKPDFSAKKWYPSLGLRFIVSGTYGGAKAGVGNYLDHGFGGSAQVGLLSAGVSQSGEERGGRVKLANSGYRTLGLGIGSPGLGASASYSNTKLLWSYRPKLE
jgi:hypothetical protein